LVVSEDGEEKGPKPDRRAIREAAREPLLAKKNAEKEAGRTLVKGKGRSPGRPVGYTRKDERERTNFVGKLLDRGATRQQVIDALMKARSSDPTKPGGLGLTYHAASSVWDRAKARRGEEFVEEARSAREEQALRLRGHISGAVADKQYGAVASLEREYREIMGTKAPARQVQPRGELRDLVADALGDMTPEQILALAGEDGAGGEDEDA
jgi:hypothetical protein